jgi:hypothetical protein
MLRSDLGLVISNCKCCTILHTNVQSGWQIQQLGLLRQKHEGLVHCLLNLVSGDLHDESCFVAKSVIGVSLDCRGLTHV